MLPSKFLRYKESVFPQIPKVLSIIEEEADYVSISDLYRKCVSKVNDVERFLYILDVLFLLDYIEFDSVRGGVSHVKRNPK